MAALNRVQLIGRLGKTPETRQTPNGKNVCTFSVAVNRTWKNGDDRKASTDWFNIEVWGRMGEICQEYLAKGSSIFLEGRLKTDRFEQDGQIKYFTKVVASQMQMLDKRTKDAPDEEVDHDEE